MSDDPDRTRRRAVLVWLLLALPGLFIVLLPGVLILAAIAVFFLAECIALPILLSREGRDGVNEPKFPWTV